MHEFSLMAPQHPKNAMIKTIAPIAIKITGADHNSSPEIQIFISFNESVL